MLVMEACECEYIGISRHTSTLLWTLETSVECRGLELEILKVLRVLGYSDILNLHVIRRVPKWGELLRVALARRLIVQETNL